MHTGVPGQISIAADGLRVGIAASRFHGEIVERLIGGAREALAEYGLPGSAIGLERVPGAWELPFALDRMAATGRWDGLLALGTLIRGETSHYEVIAHVSAGAIAEVSRQRQVPISYGVLTCETIDQAMARSGGSAGNLGADAARAVLEMAALARRLKSGQDA